MSSGRFDSSSVALFVEILNKYLYFFDKGCTAVTPEVLMGLLQLIGNELSNSGNNGAGEVDSCYAATLAHIKSQQAKEGDIGARYAAISV